MQRFRYRLIDALVVLGALGGLAGLDMGVSGCGEAKAVESPQVAVSEQPLIGLSDLGKQCGFVCPGDKDANGVEVKGIAEGNASISGVPAVDGFFASVVNFQTASKGVAAGIDAELKAIQTDFQLDTKTEVGVALKAKLDASLEAGYSLKVEPPSCKADFQAQLDAAARCDASVSGGKAMIECKGGCDVEANAEVKCDASAELRCTVNPPMGKCEGECTGSCDVDVSADGACTGECRGGCDGECSAWVKDGSGAAQCQGQCSGKCSGKCRVEVSADVNCKAGCTGECTITKPSGGCEGGIRAQCKAKANASIMCDTKCDADFEPPMVKAECKAKVQADAKLNVQCTPPRVAFNYKVKASLNAEARLRFEAALKTFIDVRLPALKAAVKRSESVASAGANLVGAADGALKASINETIGKAGVDVKVVFGLNCAVEELGEVKTIIDGSKATLDKSVAAAAKVNDALKI